VKNVFRRKLKRRDTCARLVRNKAIPKPIQAFFSITSSQKRKQLEVNLEEEIKAELLAVS